MYHDNKRSRRKEGTFDPLTEEPPMKQLDTRRSCFPSLQNSSIALSSDEPLISIKVLNASNKSLWLIVSTSSAPFVIDLREVKIVYGGMNEERFNMFILLMRISRNNFGGCITVVARYIVTFITHKFQIYEMFYIPTQLPLRLEHSK